MRIVGGAFKGRALATPELSNKNSPIRPTSDRVRETIFNIIAHRFPQVLAGGRVLDIFAGTGAMGLEALSRGSSFCVFVDNGVEARALIRENVQRFGVAARTKLINRAANEIGTAHPFSPFDMIVLDPPYNKGLGEMALQAAIAGGWLANEALIVLEESATATITLPPQVELIDTRMIGDTQVVLGRYTL